MGDPREVTPAFIREALLASVDEVSSYPRAIGLPELRSAIAGLDRPPLRGRRSTRRRRSCRRSARRRRSSRSRRSRSARRSSSRSPSPPIRSTSAARCSRVRGVVTRAAERARRLAARSRRVRRVGRDRALLDVLPEQPDRRRRAARRSTRSSPRARASTGSWSAPTRRTRSSGSTSRRSRRSQVAGPGERRGLQHALEALVDDRVPLGLRLRARARSATR